MRSDANFFNNLRFTYTEVQSKNVLEFFALKQCATIAASEVLEHRIVKRPFPDLRPSGKSGPTWNETPYFLMLYKSKTLEIHGGLANDALKKKIGQHLNKKSIFSNADQFFFERVQMRLLAGQSGITSDTCSYSCANKKKMFLRHLTLFATQFFAILGYFQGVCICVFCATNRCVHYTLKKEVFIWKKSGETWTNFFVTENWIDSCPMNYRIEEKIFVYSYLGTNSPRPIGKNVFFWSVLRTKKQYFVGL